MSSSPLRWRVRPWGTSGYTVTRLTGGVLVAPDLDTVMSAALQAGVGAGRYRGHTNDG